MRVKLWLNGLCVLAFLHMPQAQAAVAAPTKPVSSKNLSAPYIPSDTRNLEAIVDKDTATVSSPAAVQPAPSPQTILVMPSAAIAPPPAAPPVNTNTQEASKETNGWYQWTDEPTSVFTAFIALFAFLLTVGGGYYVYMTRAIARRQLRAYVFIAQTEINGVAAATQPVSQLVIRNTGQTPAHGVMVYGNMVFDEFPLTKDLPVLVFSDPQLTKENLGPNSERYKWDYALTPLTETQIAQMNAGTHALYVYGEIRYRDVFKKKRTTKYLYYTGGGMGIRDTILGGYPVGNEVS